jgi:hypothetical protein
VHVESIKCFDLFVLEAYNYRVSDYFFKHFYDNVRDPSWPEVSTYSEFLKLPSHLTDECRQQHNLMARLRELEDRDYWISHSDLNLAYTHQHVAFLPVPKCASSAYKDLFHDQLGWQPVQLSEIDFDQVRVFSLIIHPLTRRLKGVVESISKSYGYDFDAVLSALHDPCFLDFVTHVMMVDHHSTPYSLIWEPWFEKIHWIPMDILSPQELHKEIIQFLTSNNIHIDVPEPKKLNISDAKKILVYQILQDKILSTEPPAELGLMFARDIKLYHTLVEKYATM